jgi:[ribosomal protein S5]-alanine N-acetyltransferase
MENMPYKDGLMRLSSLTPDTADQGDWRTGLPVLQGEKVSIRELRLSDARALFAMLSSDEVGRFISPPPSTLEGFERFIVWTHRERQEGRYVCFAVVPHGSDHPVGIFQVRQLDFNFETAEWGFAIGSPYWGSGVFMDAARLVLEFAFAVVGVHRLEARSAVANVRGNGALLKLGATLEGVLRRSFLRNGKYQDQHMWSILEEDFLKTLR